MTKHRKSTHSNLSRSSRKANHKHIWEPCIVHYGVRPDRPPVWYDPGCEGSYGIGEYCSICDKVKLLKWWYIDEKNYLHSDLPTIQKAFPNYVVKEDTKW